MRFHPTTKRVAVVIMVAFAIIVASSQTLFAAQNSRASSPSQTITLHANGNHVAVAKGEINLAKLPVYKGGATGPAHALPVDRPLKTPAQLAAQAQWDKAHASALPHATGQTLATKSPNFLTGSSTIPSLVNQGEGINFTQSGCGCTPPDQAVGAQLGVVVEGVNNLITVYNTSYTKIGGPWTAQSFFAPVFHSGDFFSDPQITYDAERGRWFVAWLEINSSGSADYIDFAISKNNSFTGPSNFIEYQVAANIVGANNFCDYPTLGYEYWSLTISCVDFNPNFAGNSVFLFSINGMIAGSTHFVWFNNIPLDIGGGAYRLSPVTEDGTPQAEWVIATDAGFGVTSSSLTLCAFTNTHALDSGNSPTGTCDFNTLPLNYDDPNNAAEPGGGGVYPGVGTKQVMYANGQIYFALPIAINCSGTTDDGILWNAVTPQLTTNATANPQQVNGIVSNYTNSGYWCYTTADSYMPTMYPSMEGDASLVFNYSNSSTDPSIVYTGRMADDAPGSMGQGNSAFVVVGSSQNNTGRFGDYSACALLPNLTVRGIIFCGGEYGGNDLWNTRLYQLRMQ